MEKIGIAFHPGAYGTFLEWSLKYFNSRYPEVVDTPFNKETGSAHNGSKQLKHFQTTENILTRYNNQTIFRWHPKIEECHRLIDNLIAVHKYCSCKIIYITHTIESDMALIANNNYFKIKPELNSWVDLIKRKSHVWGTDDPWCIRESLSFFLEDSLISQWDNHQLDDIKKLDFVTTIDVRELLENYPSVVKKFIPEQFLVNTEKFTHIHQEWLNLQQHTCKDIHIQQYIDNPDFVFSDMTIIDEAIIQHKLRQKGVKIACVDLNKFPPSSKDLPLTD